MMSFAAGKVDTRDQVAVRIPQTATRIPLSYFATP